MPLEVRQNGDVLILVPSEARLDAQAAIPFRDSFTREAGAHAGPVAHGRGAGLLGEVRRAEREGDGRGCSAQRLAD